MSTLVEYVTRVKPYAGDPLGHKGLWVAWSLAEELWELVRDTDPICVDWAVSAPELGSREVRE